MPSIATLFLLTIASAHAADLVPHVHAERPTRPALVEPALAWTFDPAACEPHTYNGTGVLYVLGPRGTTCRFVVSSTRRLTATTPIHACELSRTAPPLRVEDLHEPRARCESVPFHDVADRVRTVQAEQHDGALSEQRAIVDGKPAIHPSGLGSVRFRLGIWPRSRLRPDLATLDPADRLFVGREVVFDLGAPGSSIFRDLLFAAETFPHRCRFSMPIYEDRDDTDELTRGVPARGGPYVAAEFEIVRVTEAPVVKTTGPIDLDVASCVAGYREGRTLGYGSRAATILGPKGDECAYDDYEEEEGGYRILECRVARSVRVVRVDAPRVPDRAGPRCTFKRSGNVMAERGPVSLSGVVPGTGYAFSLWTVDRGSGRPIARGDALDVTLRTWVTDAASTDAVTLPVGPPLAERDAHIVVGSATFGKAIDEVLLAEGQLGRGGRVRYQVRTDVLGRFVTLLRPVPITTGRMATIAVDVH